MNKKYIFGFLFLIILVLLFKLGFYLGKSEGQPSEPFVQFFSDTKTTAPKKLSFFNPNLLDERGWVNLGFSEKQARTILKFKQVVGGNFVSKEQFSKCYAVSNEKFKELAPYILLPNQEKEENKTFFSTSKINVHQKFNPDTYSVNDWVRLGFSEKQAQSFINYKNYLGGSFQSKEKLKECYTLSPENYQKLAPYLLLPERVIEEKNQRGKEGNKKIKYTEFDPNDLNLEGWMALGFSEKQSQVILHYKEKKLLGYFKNAEDLKNCFVISEEKFQEIRSFIQIKVRPEASPVKEVGKQTTDFSQIDLNQITKSQLLEFGFSEIEVRSFLGFRKILGGFVDKSQILETYHLNRDLAEKLIKITKLNTSQIPRYDLVSAPEEFLKKHPYFRKYADKIIYNRISTTDENKIIKQSAISSEDWRKMKMYLK